MVEPYFLWYNEKNLTKHGGWIVVRNNIVFIGEDNRTNSELFQLLNWRFNVICLSRMEEIIIDNLKEQNSKIMVISLVGNKFDFNDIFDELSKECSNIPIVVIGTNTECDVYDTFYKNEQFHKILRPVTGKKVLDMCRALVMGKEYKTENDSAQDTAQISDEKAHILVVDDNAMMLRSIKNMLDEKYSVAVAASGVQAFVAIGKKMPDLILLDYEMPQMNGKEVMEKLQSDGELSEIPVVFLTSADSKEIVMELLALKPAGYILKPVDADMLFNKLEEIIGK